MDLRRREGSKWDLGGAVGADWVASVGVGLVGSGGARVDGGASMGFGMGVCFSVGGGVSGVVGVVSGVGFLA